MYCIGFMEVFIISYVIYVLCRYYFALFQIVPSDFNDFNENIKTANKLKD